MTPEPPLGTIHAWYGPQNKYTVATIAAILESSGFLDDGALAFETVRDDIAGCLARIKEERLENQHHHHFFMFSVNSYHAAKIFKIARTVDAFRHEEHVEDHVHVLAGGPHVTARPGDALASGVDVAFVHEGEVAINSYFTNFLTCLRAGHQFASHGKDERVPNLRYHATNASAGSTIVQTPAACPVNLNDYPPIAASQRLFRPIEISRGCPHGCKYCQTPALFGREMRHRSVDNVVAWVARAVLLKYNKVWFTTPNAFAFGSKGTRPEPATLEALLRGLARIHGLEQVFFGTFPSEVRPEFVTQATIDAVAPHIANDTFVVGAQSASPRVLSSINRGHSIDDVWHAVDIITGAGFKIDIDMIFGLPGVTQDDVDLDIDFIKAVLARQGTRVHGHVFMPLPGTAFEQEAPGKIPADLARVLGRFATRQRVFGSHFHQQHRARKIRETTGAGEKRP